MRRLAYWLLATSLGLTSNAQSVRDPVADYAEFHALGPDTLYKLETDLNNDGRAEILLDTKESPQEAAEPEGDRVDPNVRFFSVYIALPDRQYLKSRGIDEGRGIVNGMVPQIDTSHVFVGFVDELAAFGAVTVLTSTSDDGEFLRRVVAYRIQSDHLVSRLLAQYPADAKNSLYDKYFSTKKPTDVEEVSAPGPSPTVQPESISPSVTPAEASFSPLPSPVVSHSEVTPTPTHSHGTPSVTVPPTPTVSPTPSNGQGDMPPIVKILLSLGTIIIIVFVATKSWRKRPPP